MNEQIQLPLEPEQNRATTNLDLSFLLEAPVFDTKAILTIDALAPLSMVTSMPGKYYRSQPEPTPEMLYGILENALGWHLGDKERSELLKKIQKKLKLEAKATGVGFKSLLQFHLRFASSVIPPLLTYDDYWSQHLKGASFVGGSRTYDYNAIPVMNAIRGEKITANDTGKASRDKSKIDNFQDGDTLHISVLRPYFPQYYSSPTPRGYVVPQGVYKYRIETCKPIADCILTALNFPVAPLYLGSNDGWIEACWEVVK